MMLKIVRFLSLLFTSLIAGVGFCHVLELPNKMTLPATTWLNVQQSLYRGFAIKAGSIEIGAIVSTLALLFLLRKQRMSFVWTLIASVCLVAGFVVFFSMVYPVNLLVENWTATSLPTNWTNARDRWEYGHAIHAAFFIFGLVALILAVLADTTTDRVQHRT
ncbi:DUF1772 domain-containing protein [Pleurocapsales cyanobacterium LEGE 06147]|nr:DUF1772 domain-containing protein [Pleurocapsales cyanobacterium LEGE 06147]